MPNVCKKKRLIDVESFALNRHVEQLSTTSRLRVSSASVLFFVPVAYFNWIHLLSIYLLTASYPYIYIPTNRVVSTYIPTNRVVSINNA